jgi:molecular chaperone DnaK
MGETKQPAFAVGFDFGTTNSTACAAPPSGVPEAVDMRQPPDRERLGHLPGFIYFAGGNRIHLGQAAKRYYHLKPHRVFRSVKRGLDRIYRVGKRSYCGADLARILLRHMVRECSAKTGEPLRECVLTVPATFGHREREVLRGALLGAAHSLRRVYLLDEPLAAFLAHMNDSGTYKGRAADPAFTEHALLADMGGGTTDLAVLKVQGTGTALRVSPLAVWSHLELGGDDFDRFVAADMAAARRAEGLLPLEGMTGSEKMVLRARFMMAAEEVKLALARGSNEVSVEVKGLQGEAALTYRSDERRYAAVTRPLLDALAESFRYVLERAGLGSGDIDRVILTGGMSRAGVTGRAVRGFFGRDPELSRDPQSAVARGAWYHHAALLLPERRDVETLRPVLTKALFLRMQAGRMLRIMPSCLPVPTRTRIENRLVTPIARNQALRLPFYQGDDEGGAVRPLVTLTLGARRRLPPGMPVTVDIEVDENKMISLEAHAGGEGREELSGAARVWGL